MNSLLQELQLEEVTTVEQNFLTGTVFTNTVKIFLPKLTRAGASFLSSVSGVIYLDIGSCFELDSGAFASISGETLTVKIHPALLTNADYIALKANNTITELLDNDVIEQTTTSADLTTTATTGAALACDGATQAQLTLTLGTATTAPALQMQGSDDGTNWYNLGVSLVGITSSTVTIQLDNILPKNLRWKVSTAGVSIGVGYKIILKAL